MKNLTYVILVFLLLSIVWNGSLVVAQTSDNKPCISTDDLVCVSSKQLKKRILFLNDLKPPSTVALTRIKDRTVLLDILVNRDGKVTKASALRGHPALKPVAIAVAYNSKFFPMEINGQRRNMTGKLTLKWIPED